MIESEVEISDYTVCFNTGGIFTGTGLGVLDTCTYNVSFPLNSNIYLNSD